MARRLTRLAVMDFRFLATLGMTVRRSQIVAATPFYLPLSPHQGGRDFQAPIRGYSKVSPVSWYGVGFSRVGRWLCVPSALTKPEPLRRHVLDSPMGRGVSRAIRSPATAAYVPWQIALQSLTGDILIGLHHLVADTMLGEYVPGALHVVAQLSAEGLDERTQDL